MQSIIGLWDLDLHSACFLRWKKQISVLCESWFLGGKPRSEISGTDWLFSWWILQALFFRSNCLCPKFQVWFSFYSLLSAASNSNRLPPLFEFLGSDNMLSWEDLLFLSVRHWKIWIPCFHGKSFFLLWVLHIFQIFPQLFSQFQTVISYPAPSQYFSSETQSAFSFSNSSIPCLDHRENPMFWSPTVWCSSRVRFLQC